jgi:chorismate synthase
MSNTIGNLFRFTSFGESHGKCVGALIDGCPAGLYLDIEKIQLEMKRRRPGQSDFTTKRKEKDQVNIFSGIFNGYTTGAPLCLIIWNEDQDSKKYEKIKNTPRPSHSDYPAYIRYGGFNDYRGGGRFSGRITAGYVMAGAIAKQLLEKLGISVYAYTRSIGKIIAPTPTKEEIIKNTKNSLIRCPDSSTTKEMLYLINSVKKDGDSVGGTIETIAYNVPPGLGQPIFNSLESDLSNAFFSIPGVKAVEFGTGYKLSEMRGSKSNDIYAISESKIVTKTNNAGGIHGGISNGMPIKCRLTFKPTPSISLPQKTINLKKMKETTLQINGRHDPCIIPRAVPVVDNVMAIVLLDHILMAGLIPQILK